MLDNQRTRFHAILDLAQDVIAENAGASERPLVITIYLPPLIPA
jgi:hypothetical protein